MTALAPAQRAVPKKILFPLLFIPVFLGGVDSTLFNANAYDLPVLDDSWRLWFIDGYSIALAASVVLGSRLGARIGPGATLTMGLAVFAVAGASPALLDSPEAWTAARFVQGFGYALIISSVASAVGSLPHTSERALGYSLWILSFSMGAGSGPLVGRAFVDAGAYTLLFWLPAVVALLCGSLVWLLLRGINLGHASSTKIDVASSVLALLGFGLFVGGLQSHGGMIARLLATAAGCVILTFFCLRQGRSPDPLVDIRMLSFSRVGVCAFAFTFAAGCYTGSIFLLSAKADSLVALLPVAALALWVSLGGFVLNKLRMRLLPVQVFQVSMALCALGLAVAAFFNPWLAGFLIGLGVGIAYAAGDVYLLGSVAPKDVARAGALQETSIAVGAAMGVAGFGGLFASTGSVTMTFAITAVVMGAVTWTCRYNRGVLTA
ncbi:MFS transporter [Streptomyces sp. NPDC091272]|uniref:MFS transporter n=1 Tax=Streptomyces sp. NPDC091272 TaxID=3365981 RepID=UPI0037F493C7